MGDQMLTAAEAAARLGVKRATIYAYVSRGVLHRTVSDDGRTSLFRRDDVDNLVEGRRSPEGELRTLITTSIAQLDDETLQYRGFDVGRLLTDGATFADIANVLWQTDRERPSPWPSARELAMPLSPEAAATIAQVADSSAIAAFQLIAAIAASHDPLRNDLSPHSVRHAAQRLITAMITWLPITSSPSLSAPDHQDASLARQLWHRLSPIEDPSDDMVRALDVSLCLLAEHGFATSTFALRVAASTRANPYGAVAAGLGALGGPLHGQASALVHSMFAPVRDLERNAPPYAVAASTLGQWQTERGFVPGFGHRVYDQRDPRLGILLQYLRAGWPESAVGPVADEMIDIYRQRSAKVANIDLGLGALTVLADMPPGAGEAIFAVARTAGWVAHMLEEYEQEPLRFRPVARYAG